MNTGSNKKRGEEHALTHNTPIAASRAKKTQATHAHTGNQQAPPTHHRALVTHLTALNATFYATERAHTPTHVLH